MTATLDTPLTVARPAVPPLFRDDGLSFAPAPDLQAWLYATFIEDGAPLHNPDHAHLTDALIGVLWTNAPLTRKQRTVAGTAEIPQTMGDAWKRVRAEQQLAGWFGAVPDFLITLSGPWADEASDRAFCALIEHELYHCAQALDEFGNPKWTKEGLPLFAMRGHDVEEFVPVVQRYGLQTAEQRRFVAAAQSAPSVTDDDLTGACGTCRGPR